MVIGDVGLIVAGVVVVTAGGFDGEVGKGGVGSRFFWQGAWFETIIMLIIKGSVDGEGIGVGML